MRLMQLYVFQVSKKLCRELDKGEDEKPDYSGFLRAVIATDRLYPGTIDKMYGDGTISRLLG